MTIWLDAQLPPSVFAHLLDWLPRPAMRIIARIVLGFLAFEFLGSAAAFVVVPDGFFSHHHVEPINRIASILGFGGMGVLSVVGAVRLGREPARRRPFDDGPAEVNPRDWFS
jgi:hypothetical protein